jgi:hypothetical protein
MLKYRATIELTCDGLGWTSDGSNIHDGEWERLTEEYSMQFYPRRVALDFDPNMVYTGLDFLNLERLPDDIS